MSRILKSSTLLIGILLLGLTPTLPVRADTQNFVISSFEADYYLNRDSKRQSTLKVTENITARFPEVDQNRGIFRYIPQEYNDTNLGVNVDQVLLNGKSVKYATSEESNNIVLKIGDPNSFVRGEQTYTISYSMRNVIAFFDDHDEFYWDVNGDGWDQRFEKVVSRIHIPKALAGSMGGHTECFVGTYGENTANCSIETKDSDTGTVITISAENLGARQTLTTVTDFSKGAFEPTIYQKALPVLRILMSIGLPLITFVLLLVRWFRNGKDPQGRGTIVPDYEPPADLSVIASSVVMSESLENKAITATVIDLAIRKHLIIYEISKKHVFGRKDYELELTNDSGDLTEEEQKVVEMFFGTKGVGTKVRLSEVSDKLFMKVADLKSFVHEDLTKRGFFKSNPEKKSIKFVIAGILTLVVSIIALVVVEDFWLVGFGPGLCGILLLLFARAMPARTKEGVLRREHLLGLKLYIKMAEADRLKFLQSPAGAELISNYYDPSNPANRVKLFERLLPYAMIFGLEKEWARQFEGIYKHAPQWYHSSSHALFTSSHLVSSLNDFASISAPTSSSTSGSGGGGFSGGGGGGGGGGGW